MAALRPFLALLLCLVLIGTGGAMAVARGEMAGAQELVICTEHGQATVYLDARGRPTGAGHICPDCTMGTLASAPVVAALPLPSDAARAAELRLPAPRLPDDLIPGPVRARDPPVWS
ncbi:hypothetical protein ACFQXB_07190 [Plastorhodobacter daqingensis]|uniref:DUF2946 domain-containing protein n=1 Tax=Plastorhodobacter daqingensis TaxID=1387281 RepID=A0ABW2UH20_9RHOB